MPDREITEGFMRSRFRDLEPASTDELNKAYARYVSLAPATPLGHFETTVGTTPSGLPSLPADARRAVIYSLVNDLVYTDDGTDPSASHGMPIPAEVHFIYDTDPDENFLLWAASATEVRVAYYG